MHPPAVPWAEARRTAHGAAVPLAPVQRVLAACGGLTLAAPLLSRTRLPAFDTAAMDGYAVAGSGPWRLVGQVLAGQVRRAALHPGEAVEIATGAQVPPGTTGVLAVERATVRADGPADVVAGDVAPGQHVRRAGEECAQGDELLPAGTAVGPAVLGLAASSGADALDVRPRPAVLVLVTGSELVAAGLPGHGRVRDALGPQLPLLLRAYGARLAGLHHVVDDLDQLAVRVLRADADVVVTTGASSVGPADHLHGVLEGAGAELLVDGVDCRPGHPQVLARLPDGPLVVGLPGNPLAALVGVLTVLAPLLAGLQGRPLPALGGAAYTPGWEAGAGTRLVPVRRTGPDVAPLPHARAGMLRGAALADALAVLPPATGGAPGDVVELVPLPPA